MARADGDSGHKALLLSDCSGVQAQLIEKRSRLRFGHRFKGLVEDALAKLVLTHGLHPLAELRVTGHECAVGVLASGVALEHNRGVVDRARVIAVAPSRVCHTPEHDHVFGAESLSLDYSGFISAALKIAAIQGNGSLIEIASYCLVTRTPGLVTSTRECVEGHDVGGNPSIEVQVVDLAVVYHRHGAVKRVGERAMQGMQQGVKGLNGQRRVGVRPDLSE
jgi:hypothetical protein